MSAGTPAARLGEMIVGLGLGLIVVSLVLGAVFGDDPQWLDTATTVGFVGGTAVFGIGILVAEHRMMKDGS